MTKIQFFNDQTIELKLKLLDQHLITQFLQNSIINHRMYHIIMLKIFSKKCWDTLIAQINKYFQNILKDTISTNDTKRQQKIPLSFSDIQKAMDIVVAITQHFKETKAFDQIPQKKEIQKYRHWWQIRVMKKILQHYILAQQELNKKNQTSQQKIKLMHRQKIIQQEKKCSLTLRQACKEELKRTKNFEDTSIEQNKSIFKILIEEQRRIMIKKARKNKWFQAHQCVNNIIQTLQKAKDVENWQLQLMVSYWDLAQLHYKMHYISHAKKYILIAINIAYRMNEIIHIQKMKFFLKSLQ